MVFAQRCAVISVALCIAQAGCQANEIIARRQGDIDKILMEYGVPVMVDDDTQVDLVTEPRKSAAAATAAP